MYNQKHHSQPHKLTVQHRRQAFNTHLFVIVISAMEGTGRCKKIRKDFPEEEIFKLRSEG